MAINKADMLPELAEADIIATVTDEEPDDKLMQLLLWFHLRRSFVSFVLHRENSTTIDRAKIAKEFNPLLPVYISTRIRTEETIVPALIEWLDYAKQKNIVIFWTCSFVPLVHIARQRPDLLSAIVLIYYGSINTDRVFTDKGVNCSVDEFYGILAHVRKAVGFETFFIFGDKNEVTQTEYPTLAATLDGAEFKPVQYIRNFSREFNKRNFLHQISDLNRLRVQPFERLSIDTIYRHLDALEKVYLDNSEGSADAARVIRYSPSEDPVLNEWQVPIDEAIDRLKKLTICPYIALTEHNVGDYIHELEETVAAKRRGARDAKIVLSLHRNPDFNMVCADFVLPVLCAQYVKFSRFFKRSNVTRDPVTHFTTITPSDDPSHNIFYVQATTDEDRAFIKDAVVQAIIHVSAMIPSEKLIFTAPAPA
jgi:hypothetical protein